MTLLQVEGLSVSYGAGLALQDVHLLVDEGSVVAVLGANGAGKSTLLRAISGLLSLHGGGITAGRVLLTGTTIAAAGRRAHTSAIVRSGVGQVMEGRRLFAGLSVEENLRAGGFTLRRRAAVERRLEEILELFPALRGRTSEPAGQLSGGQQQLVAIARALMARPRLLLLDEPSLGLSPVAAAETAATLRKVHDGGTTVLLVEQQVGLALGLAAEAYVLERGRVVRHAPSERLRDDPTLTASYFGIDG